MSGNKQFRDRKGRSPAWSGFNQRSRTNRRNSTCVCVWDRERAGGRERGKERKEVFTIDHLSDCRDWQSKSKSQKSLGQGIRKSRLGWWGTVCSNHQRLFFLKETSAQLFVCVCVYVNKIKCIILCIYLFRSCWVFFAARAFLSLWRVGANLQSRRTGFPLQQLLFLWSTSSRELRSVAEALRL